MVNVYNRFGEFWQSYYLCQWEVTGQSSTCDACDFLAGIFCGAICLAHISPVKER